MNSVFIEACHFQYGREMVCGSTNSMTWKFQLYHLLMAKGLWKYVEGSAVLAEDAAGDVRKTFLAEQQKAFSTIVILCCHRCYTLSPPVSCQKMLGTPLRDTLSVILCQISYSLKSNTSGKRCVKALQLMRT